MSTINVILSPDADGTLHLPLPVGLRRGKLRVTATVQRIVEKPASEKVRHRQVSEALKTLRASGVFKEIVDPVAWQREVRKDRPLPGRK